MLRACGFFRVLLLPDHNCQCFTIAVAGLQVVFSSPTVFSDIYVSNNPALIDFTLNSVDTVTGLLFLYNNDAMSKVGCVGTECLNEDVLNGRTFALFVCLAS